MTSYQCRNKYKRMSFGYKRKWHWYNTKWMYMH